MNDMLNVTVCEGKYTVIQDASGATRALRHGEEWRDCAGDGLILGLAHEVDALRHATTTLRAQLAEQDATIERVMAELATERAEYALIEGWAKQAGVDVSSAAGATMIERAVDMENARWQRRIDDAVLAIDPDRDGSGCDSGDPLDLTMTELNVAIGKLQTELAAAREEVARWNEIMWEELGESLKLIEALGVHDEVKNGRACMEAMLGKIAAMNTDLAAMKARAERAEGVVAKFNDHFRTMQEQTCPVCDAGMPSAEEVQTYSPQFDLATHLPWMMRDPMGVWISLGDHLDILRARDAQHAEARKAALAEAVGLLRRWDVRMNDLIPLHCDTDAFLAKHGSPP